MWPWQKETSDNTSTTPSENTPTAATASANGPLTRQRASQSDTPTAFLQLPTNRPPTHLERRRNRTPSPLPQSSTAFPYNSHDSTMDEATVQRLMEAAIRATREDSTASVQRLRKPELPPFDKRNVDIWIRRVESAYTRVGCTDPALKFAHLEAKFEVNEDPTIDAFLFGAATEDTWKDFLDYLRSRFGRSKKQQTLDLINGISRDGRTPSQLAAVIDDKTKDVTLDEIKKQQLLKQLPQQVLRQIIDRVDALDFKATAALADAWFDKEGKPLLSSDATSVNQVDQPPPAAANPSEQATAAPAPFSQPFPQSDNEADVNAVRFKQGQRQHFNVANRGGRGRGNGNNNFNSRRQGNNNNNNHNNNTNSYGDSSSYARSNQGNASGNKKKVCGFHIRFGDKAERCESWCMMYPQHQRQSNGKASQ